MIQENLRLEFNNYINDMASSYIGSTGKQIDDVIYEPDFLDQVQQDLEDKGFTAEEASGIAMNSFLNEDVEYRMLAYLYALYNGYENIDELKEIIAVDSLSVFTDFTEEEIEKIFKAKERVDY